MQDEINTKVVALIIRTGSQSARLTSQVLKEALIKFMEAKENYSEIRHGKQTVGQLMRQNTGLTNLEITDENIKSFERVARKYNIDFALQKDRNAQVPKYLVFFKVRDVDVMNVAFQEYVSLQMKPEQKSVIKKMLENMREQSVDLKPKEKVREKERGMER